MDLKIWQAIDVVDNALSMFATDGKRVAITTWTRNYDDISFRRKTAEWLFSDGGYTMNIAQLARMKDEKLVDSYTTA
ncbi:hypothetical protein ACIMO0_08825 [Escherichia coli]|uniref:hypothetical protein n=1 Tax=Escherichia coli TaxID=562 RepID=UPI0006A19601|nr:hypothetical protein [Escherichia coli]EHP2010068.1 hypothetical protein [Escherichia coli]EHP3239755.1 hypothetical protein [Escherichia coli]EHP3246214.1 hypothetical protein [Escherichia coli]MDC9168424.1 hypothetical protein [Escherichia coli]MDN1876673.1 hypothetical protein [Escherichia coli]